MRPAAPPFCHCWRARLGPVAPTALATLAADERTRLARFHRPASGQAYAGAHLLLRTVLGHYTGQAPAELVLEADARHKPTLTAREPLFFNLSYRARWALLAVSNAGEVGADVEETRPVTGTGALVEQLFSAAEQAALQPRSGQAWWALFFEIWTRKEAWAKMQGMGLAQPFTDFSVATGVGPDLAWQVPGPGFMHGFALDADHAVALAVQPQNSAYIPTWQYFDFPAAIPFISSLPPGAAD